MTDTTNANIPGASPLVDTNGQITPVWYQFLLALFNRTGGAGTPTDITGLQLQVDEQDVEINTTPIPIPPPSNAITYRPSSNIFRSVQSKLRDGVSLKDFGAKLDGVTDDTLAVQAAMASGEPIIDTGTGICAVSGTISVSTNGFHLRGAGRGAFSFVNHGATNIPTLSVNDFLSYVTLEGFTLDRIGSATSGGDGLQWTGSNSHGVLRDIVSQNNFKGFSLGITDFSTIDHCYAMTNQGDGFYWDNARAIGAFQWNLHSLLASNNGSNGYFYNASNAAGLGCSMGTAVNINSFANSLHGYVAVGTAACPISGLRLNACFFGQDGDNEISLDTYGDFHCISNCFTELAGTGATGPTSAIPPSNVGSGIFATANNVGLNVIGGRCATNSKNGIVSSAGFTDITGVEFTNNGFAGDLTNAYGIYHAGGLMNVSGGRSGNVGGATYTKYGAVSVDGSKFSATGIDCSSAATNAFNITSNATQAVIVGSRGANTIIPTGSVTVGQATGSVPANGSLNVSSGAFLNGVAYANVPVAKVLATASTQSVVSGSQVTVTGWATSLDAGSNFNASTGIFTAPAAGDYLVSAGIDTGAVVSSGTQLAVIIVRNAVNLSIGYRAMVAPLSGVNNGASASTLVRCVAGDTIKIQAFQTTGATISLAGGGGVYVAITQVP